LPLDLGVTLDRSQVKFKSIRNPIWTKNKAKLIERYIFYFIQVTHHGTYIDGFAGAQYSDHPEAWAAKLALELRPRWLRNFFLCERKLLKFQKLEVLRNEQPARERGEPKRVVQIYHDDFNNAVTTILGSGKITAREATFCLLDQHTFECKWSTVERLARHKNEGHKIELFYFLAAGWFGRAMAGIRNTKILEDWWGRNDWKTLRGMSSAARAELVCERFRKELGYTYAYHFPILSKAHGRSIAYHMVHATDHPIAPGLMMRAYRNAVTAKETAEQLSFLDQLGAQSPAQAGRKKS
jgi:three-Cys-motif partner protein